jgi:hypothetical protein
MLGRALPLSAAGLVAGASILIGLPSATADTAPLLIGVTFTHSMLASDCDMQKSIGIVAGYNAPGERRLVRSQLAAMRASGIDSIRFLLWFTTDTTGQPWAMIPSGGGRVSEPYRSNLIRFVSDIRAAGFSRLTISFGPEGVNDPIGIYNPDGTITDHWDPAKLDENWSFIADVHRLVKPYAPDDTVFDILSEIPPSRYQPDWAITRLNDYTRQIWTRYASTFGLGDAVISIAAKNGQAADRVAGLIRTLQAIGVGYPADIELHTDWTSPAAYADLVAVDHLLTANGLSTPLVMGESSYENPEVASDVARFEAQSSRPVPEVFEWYQTTDGGPCLSPPYRADAYISALKHETPPPQTPFQLLPVPTLHASVSSKGVASLRTSSGKTVKTLDAGTYDVVVADHSRTVGFHLSGPVVAQTTGNRFVGRRRWPQLEIGSDAPYGSRFFYSGTRKSRFSFVVD